MPNSFLSFLVFFSLRREDQALLKINGEEMVEMTRVHLPGSNGRRSIRDNESPTILLLSWICLWFPLFLHLFIFSSLVFLFHNTGICSEQHPSSRKPVGYFRQHSITLLDRFRMGSKCQEGQCWQWGRLGKEAAVLAAACSKTSCCNRR